MDEISMHYPSFNSIDNVTVSQNLSENDYKIKGSNKIDEKLEHDELTIEIDDKGETKSYYGFYSYHTFQLSLISKSSSRLLSFRRYKHFVIFANFMRKKYPYFLFPDIPPKNILGNIPLNIKEKQNLEKERVFALSFFLNYLYKMTSIRESREFRKFLYDAYFDETFFDQIQPFYSFPEYENYTIKGRVYNYFSSLFYSGNQLVVQNKEEMDILFKENYIKSLYNILCRLRESYYKLEKILNESDQNCKDFITDLMLLKDIKCFDKSEKLDFSHFSIKMQNLKSLYYFNIENEIQKPLNLIKETVYLLKGILLHIKGFKDFLILLRKFNDFINSNNTKSFDYKKDLEALNIKKEYYILNLLQELNQFISKTSRIVDDNINEFIKIYASISGSVFIY